MARNRKEQIQRLYVLFGCWGIGVLVGGIIACIFMDQYRENYENMQRWMYQTVSGIELNSLSYFWLNLQSHGKELIVIFFVSYTILSFAYNIIFCFFKGISVGFVWGSAIYIYQMKGFFLAISYYLPQGIFYGAAVVIMLLLSQNIKEKTIYSFKKAQTVPRFVPMLLLCVLLICIGAYIEGNTNLIFLKKTLNGCIS